MHRAGESSERQWTEVAGALWNLTRVLAHTNKVRKTTAPSCNLHSAEHKTVHLSAHTCHFLMSRAPLIPVHASDLGWCHHHRRRRPSSSSHRPWRESVARGYPSGLFAAQQQQMEAFLWEEHAKGCIPITILLMYSLYLPPSSSILPPPSILLGHVLRILA